MGTVRLLLALSVILHHTTPHSGLSLIGGSLAVEGFFVISGFYMALILNEKYIGANGSYKLFLSNRLLRLYPVYWTVLLLVTLYCTITYITANELNFISYFVQYYNQMDLLSFGFLVFTNLTMFFQDAVLFLGLNAESGNLFFTKNVYSTSPHLFEFLAVGQAWSIGIELSFYLLAPFLMRRSWKLILPLIALSFSLHVIAARNGLNFDPWTYRFFPFELGYFLLGKIAYDLYRIVKKAEVKKAWCYAALGAVVVYLFVYSQLPPFSGKSSVFIAILFLSIPLIFHLTKKWKRDAFVGELSYPIYIVHMALIGAISTNPLIIVPASLLAAFLLNEFVAKPVEKFRQGRLDKPTTHPRKVKKPIWGIRIKLFRSNRPVEK